MNKEQIKKLLEGVKKDQISGVGSSTTQNLQMISDIVSLFPENGEGGAVLEIGANDYSRLLPLTRMNYRTYGISMSDIDPDLTLIEGWRKHGILIERAGKANDRLPHPSDSFDWVICSESDTDSNRLSMHLLAEIKRVLRPKGRLILQTPNTRGIRTSSSRKVRIKNVVESIGPEDFAKDGDDSSELPISEMIERYGFNILLRLYSDSGAGRSASLRSGISRFLNRLVPNLKDTVVLVCEMK